MRQAFERLESFIFTTIIYKHKVEMCCEARCMSIKLSNKPIKPENSSHIEMCYNRYVTKKTSSFAKILKMVFDECFKSNSYSLSE